MPLLVTSEVLGKFNNTITADDKYSFPNRENLRQPIQMQLSQKQKRFSEIFVAFLKNTSDFEHFQKKDDPHTFPKLETAKGVVRETSKETRFKTPFHSKHA